MIKMSHFIDLYLAEFPEEKDKVDDHISLNGMFLGHVFFDESICGPLCHLIKTSSDPDRIRRLVELIEKMLLEGDAYVKSIVTINILNKIRGDKELFEKAKPYLSEELIVKFQEIAN